MALLEKMAFELALNGFSSKDGGEAIRASYCVGWMENTLSIA